MRTEIMRCLFDNDTFALTKSPLLANKNISYREDMQV